MKAGASYSLYYKQDSPPYEGCYFRLIHILAAAEEKLNDQPTEDKVHYAALIRWLDMQGESLDEARADLVRWKKWKEEGRSGLIEKEYKVRTSGTVIRIPPEPTGEKSKPGSK